MNKVQTAINAQLEQVVARQKYLGRSLSIILSTQYRWSNNSNCRGSECEAAEELGGGEGGAAAAAVRPGGPRQTGQAAAAEHRGHEHTRAGGARHTQVSYSSYS